MTEPTPSADPEVELRSRPLFRLTARVSAPYELGGTGETRRRIVAIQAGEFDGPQIRGEVLPVGGDWMTIGAGGATQIDVRALLRTEDGALIELHYTGHRHGPPEVMAALARGEVVDPSSYYFRVTARFITAAPAYAWLNRIVAVGVGRRPPEGPIYHFFEIL
ncbi:MAG TPA: DUF3237 domain-containing protein [Candidatus Dormibacteraeota bacterium]|nr:DUF3237 domain-containing protein [Candidatus Dormibacteraeota bacterium]